MRPLLHRTLAGVLLLAAVRGAEAQQQQVRVTQRTNVRSDSLVKRIFNSDVSDVKRMVTEWREREQRLVNELRAVPQEDFPTRRRLEDDLAQHTRDGFAMMSAIEARCVDGGGALPAGYLGLNIESIGRLINNEPQQLVSTVTSVEPGSPAERVGLQRGDTLLSIGGVEPRRMGEIGAMLVPGRSMTIRVVRDGMPREFTLVVARRPEGFGESCGEFERALMPMRVPGRVFVRDRSIGPRVQVDGREAGAEDPPEIRVMIFGADGERETATGFFAGAEFRPLDADWREVLGVRQGVMVIKVAAGSPAATSGLKSGDVVTAVGSAPVASPVTLVQLLAASKESDITLQVVRAKDRRTITLKLGQR
jgi:C-terminal processing protease CtpA/Prc